MLAASEQLLAAPGTHLLSAQEVTRLQRLQSYLQHSNLDQEQPLLPQLQARHEVLLNQLRQAEQHYFEAYEALIRLRQSYFLHRSMQHATYKRYTGELSKQLSKLRETTLPRARQDYQVLHNALGGLAVLLDRQSPG